MQLQTGVSAARGVGRCFPRSAPPHPLLSLPLQAPRFWVTRAATVSTAARVGLRGCRCGSLRVTLVCHQDSGRHSTREERARKALAGPPLAAPAALPVCSTWRHAASLDFQERSFLNVSFLSFRCSSTPLSLVLDAHFEPVPLAPRLLQPVPEKTRNHLSDAALC